MHILVVDDEANIRFAYKEILSSVGYQVISAKNGQEAEKCLQDNLVDLIVTDLIMQNGDGIELAVFARSLQNRPKILAVTGGGARISAHNALAMGEHFFDAALTKPVSDDALLTTINHLLSTQH
ncbi:MAG: response regulator [Methylocystaceae bacterium]|nr:response regulator [Methylocystaceae bacterium]